MVQSLRHKLVQYLLNSPKDLEQIYARFATEKETTIRGRLNENLNRYFKRLSKGVYIAVRGNTKALLIEGNSWDKIKLIDENSIDLIIADPPYSVLNPQLETGTTRKKSGHWQFKTRDVDPVLLAEFIRVLKPGGHFFMFMPSDANGTLRYNMKQIDMAIDAGFTFHKKFIWDKVYMGMGYTGRARYEAITFFSKGKKRMPIDRSIPDVLVHKRISPQLRIHETEKPVDLIKDILYFSTKPGEWVLDPFAGSFNTIQAALETGRHSIGIELNRKWVGMANKRFGGVKLSRVWVRRVDGIPQRYHKRIGGRR